jgi:hypothetical protein
MELALDWTSSAFLPKFPNKYSYYSMLVHPTFAQLIDSDHLEEDPKNEYDNAKAQCAYGIPAAC